MTRRWKEAFEPVAQSTLGMVKCVNVEVHF